MARTERIFQATPEQVFEALSDPRNYAFWVVGSKAIRDYDESWPQPGSRFHHTVGFGPVKVRDHSQVEEIEAPYRMKLRVKARPLGTAFVTMKMDPMEDGRTRVTMIEDPADFLTALIFNPLTHLLVRGRNVKSLERLAELVERDLPPPVPTGAD